MGDAADRNSPARNASHTAMDTIDRVLREMCGDDSMVDRILILTIAADGDKSRMYSNARSEAELNGMLWNGLMAQTEADEDDD
jgi:hypothetical protein